MHICMPSFLLLIHSLSCLIHSFTHSTNTNWNSKLHPCSTYCGYTVERKADKNLCLLFYWGETDNNKDHLVGNIMFFNMISPKEIIFQKNGKRTISFLLLEKPNPSFRLGHFHPHPTGFLSVFLTLIPTPALTLTLPLNLWRLFLNLLFGISCVPS